MMSTNGDNSRDGDPWVVLFPPPLLQMNQLIDATFNHPTNPSAILFLVESMDAATCLSQQSLRDSYLLMVLEAIHRNKPPASVGSLACYSSGLTDLVLDLCTKGNSLWMSTSNLHPLEIPTDRSTHRQVLQDYASLTTGRREIVTPTSILSAIEVIYLGSPQPIIF